MPTTGGTGVTPLDLPINFEPREPVTDPTLGVTVDVDRTGTPQHRLVTIGDSLTHGFMSAAIFRTDLSWPATVAYELGLAPQSSFRYPVYEQPGGPGGLPLDLERLARSFQSRFGDRLDWYEAASALLFLRRYMDAIEDYWERGEGTKVPDVAQPYHNLAVYGWDVLDAQHLTADIVEARLAPPDDDDLIIQTPNLDNDRAARVVLESCRAADRTAQTVLQATRSMGGDGPQPDIETLVVMLGANNALGTVLHLSMKWTPEDYGTRTPRERLDAKRSCNLWRPEHFELEWKELVTELEKINARHVLVCTIPQVTIPPITRGVGQKVRFGSRYFPYYTRPWIKDADFDPSGDPHLTEDQARTIDSAIDSFNTTIIESVRVARTKGLDWYVCELGGALDRLAARRYREDPTARPIWWTPYELPPELASLVPVPDTRFFGAGSDGRTQGGLFSLDGVHPTTSAYGLVAQEVIKVMDRAAGVQFPNRGPGPRPEPVQVDMARLVGADSLLSRPPPCISPTLSLFGWLDEVLDWVKRTSPFD